VADIRPAVTIHMAASLDGFIARKDGDTVCLETGVKAYTSGIVALRHQVRR
jgi:riboflavin biosynthesis pyrimidine reductase